jgi:acyl-CoA carboxylase subunit beta
MPRLSAADFVGRVADRHSFVRWDRPADRVRQMAGSDDLRRAQGRSGLDESILTGRATVAGEPIALVVSEFAFLGGTIGAAAARRIVEALGRATRERLPVLAAPCSGGVRMQEGTPAFVRLADISRAVLAHQAAGLPYLVYLRDPTTGGVLASWGSLGHVTWAEPGALVGFLGPRVVQALRGAPLPDGVQRAEHLVAKGVIDAVMGIDELAARTAAFLRLAGSSERLRRHRPAQPPAATPGARATVWESVRLSRHPDRPGVRQLLDDASGEAVLLSGTGAGELDAGIVVALASFQGERCVVVGQDRQCQVRRPMGPAALRGARRGMRLAQDLGLPLVTVVDTPGADLSPQAEEGALAGEIARCLADLMRLTVPTVSVLLGEGGGGGAMALLPARRVIAAEHAWLAPLPPEGAAALVHRDIARAPDIAEGQRVGSWELLADGIVHHVVREPVPAHHDPLGFVHDIAHACAHALAEQATGPVTAAIAG